MATQVQTANTADGAQPTLAFGSSVVSGNLGILFLRVSTGDGTVTGITDTLGSTWIKVGSDVSISGSISQIWYAVFGASGANTISLVGGSARMLVEEVNGLAAATLDSTNQATGSSASASSGNVSPAVASWIFAGLSLANYPTVPVTVGSGFTSINLADGNRYAAEYQDSAAGGTYNGQFGLPESNDWGAIVAAFKAAAGPVPPLLYQRRIYFVDQSIIQI